MRLLAVLTVYILGFVGAAHGQGQTNDEHSSFEQSNIPSTTIQPCDYWLYEPTSSNYLCAYRPQRIQIVEATDVQNLVSTLEQRIADLEARIAKLESGR